MSVVKMRVELDGKTKEFLKGILEMPTGRSGWFDWHDLDAKFGKCRVRVPSMWMPTKVAKFMMFSEQDTRKMYLRILTNKGILERLVYGDKAVYRVKDDIEL